MRLTEFRGKDAKTGEWRHGSLINNAFYDHKTKEPIPYIFSPDGGFCFENMTDDYDVFGVIPETVGQFIRTYSNYEESNKLWEGDIYNIDNIPGNPYIVKVEEGTPYLVGNTGSYFEINYILDESCNKIYLIGNIHDNPELLETPNA